MTLPNPIGNIALELTRPGMLWAALALVPIGWYFWKSLSDFPITQRRASLSIRVLIVSLLVVALAGLTLLRPTQQMFVVLAVDRSQSIDAEATEKIDAYVQEAVSASGSQPLSLLEFAAEHTAPSKIQDQREPLNDAVRAATNIAAAIETAVASIPPGYVPHVVVLSDGRQTVGDAVQAAASGTVPISTVPIASRDEPEVQVAAVTAPAEVRQGEPFYVDVTIAANHRDVGFIDVYRGDILAIEQNEPIEIETGETQLRFRQTVEDDKQVDYSVRIRGFNDTVLDNNLGSAVVFASGKPSLLLIDSQVDQIEELRSALEEQGLLVQMRPLAGIPQSLSELQRFDCLMLSNVPAAAMSLQQMEIIRTYVQDLGGGLVMLGGDQAFGLGGYYKTTLEEILPVKSNFEKEKEKPSLAMVLVIDKSGSMGGEKIELAKDAAKGAVELLSPNDQIGIVAFDGDSYWISDVHSASDKDYVIDRIATLEASGGTNIYPGLSNAFSALASTSAKLKHIILMTDGHSTPGDYEGLVRDLVADRITLSTVACGTEADAPLLENLARTGGGRYYLCEDPQSVPQIFAKETVTASKSAINELPFLPQLMRPTPVLNGVELDTAPFLLGYVATRPKPTSEFILATESGEPLLVWWRYGLGMTVAFTSDAKSQWAAEWLTWPQFGPFWAQITRHAMRKSDAKGVFVGIEREADHTRLSIDSIDENGRFINAADTRLTVIDPDLHAQPVVMRQTAPGRYEADIETSRTGAYQLEFNQSLDGVTTFRQTRGLVVGYPDELRLGPTNESLLKQISQVSGGRYDPPASAIFEPGERTASLYQPLWPYLLMAALSLLVVDVALRRVDFSLWRRT